MSAEALSLAWWANAAAGRIVGGPADSLCERVGTDTRETLDGVLFVALRGDNFDGHDYLLQAAEGGAAGLLFEPLPEERLAELNQRFPQVGLIEADDSAVAYSRLARAWRLFKNPYVIALTGSVGKTTTRDLIAAALSRSFRLHRTKANLNNIIGVPQSVFAMPPDTELAVFELGMHIPGEISRSSLCTVPDLAVITNIGTSHIGNFADGQDGILRAKAEITDGLKEGGTLLLNGDDPYLRRLALELKERFNVVFTHISHEDPAGSLAASHPVYETARVCREAGPGSSAGRIYTASQVDLNGLHAEYVLVQEVPEAEGGFSRSAAADVRAPAPGAHHVMNTLFAFACAGELGVSMEMARTSIMDFVPTGNRQKISQHGSYRIINDAYNAAPESMLSAFELLEGLADENNGRAVAVLGCMAEQGDAARELHLQVGRDLGRHRIDRVYLLGAESKFIAEGARETAPNPVISCYDDMSALVDALLPQLEAGDNILVKGSRMYAMERAAAAIEARAGSEAGAPGAASGSEG